MYYYYFVWGVIAAYQSSITYMVYFYAFGLGYVLLDMVLKARISGLGYVLLHMLLLQPCMDGIQLGGHLPTAWAWFIKALVSWCDSDGISDCDYCMPIIQEVIGTMVSIMNHRVPYYKNTERIVD